MEVGFNSAAGAYAAQSANQTDNTNRSAKTGSARDSKAAEVQKALKSTSFGGVNQTKEYGKTIGEPTLSDKASKVYDSLKQKYGDMDFVLVANDSIDGAEQKVAGMQNGGKTIVLIDAEKLEKMAEDDDYRKKVEGQISTGRDQLAELAKQMSGLKTVQSFGMRIDDDGKTSFFAVSQKNNQAINQKTAEKREAKKVEAKKEAKKAEKKKAEEKLKEKREASRADRKDDRDLRLRPGKDDEDDFEILEADSVEELMKLVNEREYAFRSDNVMTPEESYVGGTIDFAL